MIDKDKIWAKGMGQQQFEQEWARRYPLSDVIPIAKEWLLIKARKTHGIDTIPPKYEFQPDGPLIEVQSGETNIPKLSK